MVRVSFRPVLCDQLIRMEAWNLLRQAAEAKALAEKKALELEQQVSGKVKRPSVKGTSDDKGPTDQLVTCWVRNYFLCSNSADTQLYWVSLSSFCVQWDIRMQGTGQCRELASCGHLCSAALGHLLAQSSAPPMPSPSSTPAGTCSWGFWPGQG